MNNKQAIILFSGGGTGGSVTPLLAVAKEIFCRRPDWSFSFVGTKSGPEKLLVAEAAKDLPISFSFLPAGKWRRYFSWQNFLDIFVIIWAFFRSFPLLGRLKPVAVVSAGSFVSVPLVWAARILRIPVLIHQQDLQAGLANKLMAPAARQITVTFADSIKDYGSRALLVGNPYSIPPLEKKEIVFARYNFSLARPLILVFGGGTGAAAINEAAVAKLPALLEKGQIIHLTGRGKTITQQASGYYQQEFVSHQELWSLLAAADLVIARPGLGTLTELAALKKVSLLIPMPKTHQEKNAEAARAAGAAWVLSQEELAESLVPTVHRLLTQDETRAALSREIGEFIKPGAAATLAEIILTWEQENRN